MKMPLVSREQAEERICELKNRVQWLETELARVNGENRLLTNAIASTNRSVAPFASTRDRGPARPQVRRANVFQMERALTRERASAMDLGTEPGKPPG